MDESWSSNFRVDPADLREISNYLTFARFGATAFVGFAPGHPATYLHHARGFSVQEQTLEGGVKFFSRNKIKTQSRDAEGHRVYREVTGTFLLKKLVTPNAYVFLTKDSGQYINDGLQRLLYRIRQNLTRLRLASGEMREIVSALVNHSSGRLVVRRSIVRNKRQETTVSYETELLDELYSKATAEDAHVHSFAFKLQHKRTGKLILNAGLNREGRFSFHDGDLSLFVAGLLEHASHIVKKKADLLQNRARSENTGEINPIRVTFEEPVFDKKDGVKAFLRILGRIRHGEFTIFHRNPYLHVSFFDFFDGSEFDLFVESSDTLIIVPQFQANPSSLFRLCQKISENFQEGIISEDTATIRITTI